MNNFEECAGKFLLYCVPEIMENNEQKDEIIVRLSLPFTANGKCQIPVDASSK